MAILVLVSRQLLSQYSNQYSVGLNEYQPFAIDQVDLVEEEHVDV